MDQRTQIRQLAAQQEHMAKIRLLEETSKDLVISIERYGGWDELMKYPGGQQIVQRYLKAKGFNV